MNENNSQDFLKKAVDIFEGDYAVPTKSLVWAKTIKEWTGVVFCIALSTVVVLGLAGLFIVEIKTPKQEKDVSEVAIRSMEPGSEDQQKEAAQKLTPHIKDLLAFTTVMINSANKRQEILTKMLNITALAVNKDQMSLEEKVTALSSLAKQCATEKGQFVSEIAQGHNPFDENLGQYIVELSGSDVWDRFSKDIPLNPRNESTRWNELCTLCQKAANNANQLLLEMVQKP
jgi:hypothetical protein